MSSYKRLITVTSVFIVAFLQQRPLSLALCLLFLKVSEPSDVLDTLLRLVYSTPDLNTISSFDEHVLETFLRKYHFFTALFTNIAYLGICVSFSVWT